MLEDHERQRLDRQGLDPSVVVLVRKSEAIAPHEGHDHFIEIALCLWQRGLATARSEDALSLCPPPGREKPRAFSSDSGQSPRSTVALSGPTIRLRVARCIQQRQEF